MMIVSILTFIALTSITAALQFQTNPTSEMSADERYSPNSNNTDISDESGYEVESDGEDNKDKKFLREALKIILDPTAEIEKISPVNDYKYRIEQLNKINVTFNVFLEEMDNLSLDVCQASQKALWSFVTDMNNNFKKTKMMQIAVQEIEIKKQYWNILKKKYLEEALSLDETNLKRKIRIIKERGMNVQMPQSKQGIEIRIMQQIWNGITICGYKSSCDKESTMKNLTDIIKIFKTSNDSKELAYYWRAYHDATGKSIRHFFKVYVTLMNKVAQDENFTDAGDMWRYSFDDDQFTTTVNRIWHEVSPLYNTLLSYVHAKLKAYYKEELKSNKKLTYAHLLGNLWAEEWQAIYPKVAPFPNHIRPTAYCLRSKDLFDAVDQFHQSLGFESAAYSYRNITETMATPNCLSSSYDMCDGVNYRIKWCRENVSDIVLSLSRAARILGHIQYFKHYRNLPPLYRDGPNPAFHDAISGIFAVQLTMPEQLQKLNLHSLNLIKMEIGPEVTKNHLLWLALEKFPMMAYAYVLDSWRWDVFSNGSLKDWNTHWWNLRTRKTRIMPPVPRNESNLDPAAKYHVVSHIQYIKHLVSNVLEFQILLSLCNQANYTGPLHQCSLYGNKEAGQKLSDGMALGASTDWRNVLYVMTGETELSTKGIIEYFAPLQDFLKKEEKRISFLAETGFTVGDSIIICSTVVVIMLVLVFIYVIKKYDLYHTWLALCGFNQNGSLDIAMNEMPQNRENQEGREGIRDENV